MDIRDLIEAIGKAHRQGVYDPPALRGGLTMDDGYRVLLGLLDRWRQAGESQAGWKVGLTAESIRRQVGYHGPIFAVLLASGHRSSGCVVPLAGLRPLSFETERIMSGSFVPMFPIKAGDRIEARFDPIGTVTARFE